MILKRYRSICTMRCRFSSDRRRELMIKILKAFIIICLYIGLVGCQNMSEEDMEPPMQEQEADEEEMIMNSRFTRKTKIEDVINEESFEDYGRLIFPVDEGYMSGTTLEYLRLTWYSNIDADKTVEICNYFYDKVHSGETIFFDIYTDEEKKADPWKEDTGLFFFKGKEKKDRHMQCRWRFCLCRSNA